HDAYRGKKVLVTGGLGFIGSNLVIELVEAGADVTVIDALIPQHGGDEHNLRSVRSRVKVEIADMREPGRLEPLVEGKDFVFHLAGQVSHGDSMRDPELDLAVNCVATIRLVEACRRNAPQAVLVNTSTRQVYGRPITLPVDEYHPVDPIDVNGINKLAAEYYHLLYHRVYDLRSVVLRLTNTYGPRQQITNDRQGMAGVFLCRALRGQDLKLFGTGRQVRDFNYVDDVVEALLLAASTPACYGKLFNLGATENHSLIDFCEILKKLCGTKYEIVPFPADRKIIDIGDYYGRFTRFNEATGWTPKVGLAEGLRRSIDFFREHRAHYLK
ncbi:MAG TPA: NAD-dependent epimerase/dehydratase family protein, partial [Polyangiales bacterium]|nr:NAD-dependent epimerase/dehydratase family protein [Polyangiales bacterium]